MDGKDFFEARMLMLLSKQVRRSPPRGPARWDHYDRDREPRYRESEDAGREYRREDDDHHPPPRRERDYRNEDRSLRDSVEDASRSFDHDGVGHGHSDERNLPRQNSIASPTSQILPSKEIKLGGLAVELTTEDVRSPQSPFLV